MRYQTAPCPERNEPSRALSSLPDPRRTGGGMIRKPREERQFNALRPSEISLLAAPGRPRARLVFHDDAAGRQLVPQPVGLGPVLGCPPPRPGLRAAPAP